MAVRAAPAVPEHPSRRGRDVRRMTLFRRLFLTYVAVVGLAVAVLVLAPITVSVPTALAELAVILGGFAVTLVLGIFTSLFSAILCSRVFIDLIWGHRKRLATLPV